MKAPTGKLAYALNTINAQEKVIRLRDELIAEQKRRIEELEKRNDKLREAIAARDDILDDWVQLHIVSDEAQYSLAKATKALLEQKEPDHE